MLSKEYLGEVALLLQDWFANREGMYASDCLTTRGMGAGEMQGGYVLSDLVNRSCPLLVSAPSIR